MFSNFMACSLDKYKFSEGVANERLLYVQYNLIQPIRLPNQQQWNENELMDALNKSLIANNYTECCATSQSFEVAGIPQIVTRIIFDRFPYSWN